MPPSNTRIRPPKFVPGQLVGSIVAGEEKGYSEVKKSTATGFSNME